MSSRPAGGLEPRVVGLILLVAIGASAGIVALSGTTITALTADPRETVTLLGLVLVLQVISIQVYGRGSMSVSAVGLLTVGFQLGAGPAMTMAALAALVQWARARGVFYKAVFDIGNFAITAGAGAAVYGAVMLAGSSTALRLIAATLAGLVYSVVNNGLLCLAISLAEGESFERVWLERFHWARYYFMTWGPLALAATMAYEYIGVAGFLAFVLPPALMLISWRDYLRRTSESMDEVRSANGRLELANNDLHELFELASGVGARSHDRARLIRYVEQSLSALANAPVVFSTERDADAIELVGQRPVGYLHIDRTAAFDAERWERLQPTFLPQVVTAIESAELVERLRKVHLDTIAALSRSMEAKDYYTGGHTERVAELSVTLAGRLGYEGDELEAVQIGALLHDIGKIGIPERILHKTEPLDDEEWRVIKQHPVISDYILSEIDLPPIVRKIARSSHERIDGTGYPDGLAGEEIPLPARIVLVSDALDALTSDRPYRRARPVWAALEELRLHAGTQFCPTVLSALERLYQ